MTTDYQKIQKLKKLCKKWGGNLIKKDKLDPVLKYFCGCDVSSFSESGCPHESISKAPFTDGLSVDYNKKIVYYSDYKQWPAIIHEMGHVFACEEPPENSEEFEFFGWEYCLAKYIGGVTTWKIFQKDYGIVYLDLGKGEGIRYYDLGDLNFHEQIDFLNERLTVARKSGIVKGWTPVSIRN